MIDNSLAARAKIIVDRRTPGKVTLADVLAVIEQESNGVPIFKGTEPLFKANIQAAYGNMLKRRELMTKQDLLNIITIPSGPLKGQYSKFRFEPGYYAAFAQPLLPRYPFSPAQLVLLSSSVGIGQQMLRYVVQNKTPAAMLDDAFAFMGDVDRQIEWVVGNLQSGYNVDKQLMYARYNGGPGVKAGGKTYKGYGAQVAERAKRIAVWLEENGHV